MVSSKGQHDDDDNGLDERFILLLALMNLAIIFF